MVDRDLLPPDTCKVYTPKDLAEAIVAAVGDHPGATWLEPCHGLGTFVEAISGSGVEKGRIVAIDLDSVTSPVDRLACTTRGTDFLDWAVTTSRRFDRIVGNPPFVSLSQLPPNLLLSAAAIVDLDGQPIGKGSNLWYAFVLTALRLLRQGGTLAFILPSAAEFADYCSEIRLGVGRYFEILEIFRCKRPLFDNVQEGTLVVVAQNFGSGPCTIVRRTFDSRPALIRGLSKSGQQTGHKCPAQRAKVSKPRLAFGSVATVGLGGVTGDCGYFLMTESKRAALQLPLPALLPVVSKAKHLQSGALTQGEWDRLKRANRRIWLFNPTPELANDSAVKRYLDLDEAEGGCNRKAYKVSARKPWFRTPMPPVPNAFLSGMSQHGPWLCINETETVNATNTLYVIRFSNSNRAEWYLFALAFLSSSVRRQLRRIGRHYPDGLVKYEPGPLSQVAIPEPKSIADARSLYLRATEAFLSGNLRLSREIADSICC